MLQIDGAVLVLVLVLLAAGGAARWGTTTHINHSQLDADATAAAA